MADPISGNSSPIQSTGIDQTQKTQDPEDVGIATDGPYVQVQLQQQAKHINASGRDLKDVVAQLREMVEQSRAQGPKQHQHPHGFKGFMAKAVRKLHGHHGLMSLFGKHHHGGPAAMHGLEQALAQVMSQVRAGHVPTGQPVISEVPPESQPRPEDLEAIGLGPVPAPAGDAPPLKPSDDLQDPSDDPAPNEAQNPSPAPAGNAPPELPSQSPKELGLDGPKPDPAPADNAIFAPPPELLPELQSPSDDPALNELQQAVTEFHQKWDDVSDEEIQNRLTEYNVDVAHLSRQRAQYYDSLRPEGSGVAADNFLR